MPLLSRGLRLVLIAGFALSPTLASANSLRPVARPDWVEAGHRSARQTAATTIDRLARDFSALPEAQQVRELQLFARDAAIAGDVLTFRDFMAIQIDPNWRNLPEGIVALNMIAWLPDTAEFLPTRITLARHLGALGELTDEEQAFLWKDLRARVERVGNLDYLEDLLLGMAETGHADLLLRTTARLAGSAPEQYDALLSLLDAHGGALAAPVFNRVLAELDRLWSAGVQGRRDPDALARMHMKRGAGFVAHGLIDQEADAMLRFRGRLGLLLTERSSEVIARRTMNQLARSGSGITVQPLEPLTDALADEDGEAGFAEDSSADDAIYVPSATGPQ